MTSYERELGALNEKTETHSREIMAIREEFKPIHEELKAINKTLSEAKGGWKMLLLIGGMGGAVGGVLVKLGALLTLK